MRYKSFWCVGFYVTHLPESPKPRAHLITTALTSGTGSVFLLPTTRFRALKKGIQIEQLCPSVRAIVKSSRLGIRSFSTCLLSPILWEWKYERDNHHPGLLFQVKKKEGRNERVFRSFQRINLHIKTDSPVGTTSGFMHDFLAD